MSFEIVTVPCLSDNYAYLIHTQGKTALVDAPEAAPIAAELSARGWTLDEIWVTHHHNDHIGGIAALKEMFNPMVRGAAADAKRLPKLDAAHGDGESFDFSGVPVQVLDVSGHTLGHIAFYLADAQAVFTADSLMAFGCGRVFEGTMEQMWTSLRKIAALPGDTMVYSGHEYTLNNAKFAKTIEPENADLLARLEKVKQASARSEPTVPSLLAEELETNPFLRAGLSQVKSALNMNGAGDAEVFAEIRRRKDSF
ncbi:MAG: hydroxyacylglutathione hydrolase [Silicimonas sp.]|nr:hydroxyacylglutathione hydrolase [Silicimonas sp.]